VPPSLNGTTPTPATTLQNPGFPIKALRMLDHSKGWALTEQNILFTSDGGQNWKDVTPSGSAYGKDAIGDFMSDKYAWIVSTAQPIDNSVNVLRTSDGGQHWQTSTIAVSEVSVVDAPHFLTTQEGFLELGTFGGPGAGSEAVGIFHTTDGGQNWTEVSDTEHAGGLPHGGLKTGISFKDKLNGWATGEDASSTPWLYMTHDGGHTWSLQSLPLLGNSVGHYTTTPPVIFGNDAFLPVKIGVEINVNKSVSDLVIYKSTNGGTSWSTYTLAKFTSDDLYIANIHNAWASDQDGNIYGTSDAGENWSKLASTVDTIKAFSFTDTSYGWAISDTKLWHTTDGGSHWSEIVYHILP
jgi:photosystem II stability/assembly factor-like uncharacterized protein